MKLILMLVAVYSLIINQSLKKQVIDNRTPVNTNNRRDLDEKVANARFTENNKKEENASFAVIKTPGNYDSHQTDRKEFDKKGKAGKLNSPFYFSAFIHSIE